MPSILALILCTIFVLYLLRLDRKQSPDVSRAFWIPTIWMLYIASKTLAFWFGAGGESVESGSPLDQVFISVLLCMGMILLVFRKFSWSRAMKGNAWLILLIGYMLVSVLWSDIPFISFKRWIRDVLVALIMAFVVATERDPRQSMESLLRRSVYILIPFSILLIKYFPKFGVVYSRWEGTLMWTGVTSHKNGLGRLCMISAFFLVWSLFKRWQGRDKPVAKYQTYADVFVLIMTIVLLIGPGGVYSATSIGALATGLVAFVSLLWMKKRQINLRVNTWVVIMALIIVYGISVPMMGGLSLGGVTSGFGRDATLTGRTAIWAGLLHYAEQHPILGCGYGGFWTTRMIEKFEVNEAHNGYLELLLELGYVGLFLTAVFLLSCVRKAQRELVYNFDWGLFWICLLLMVVVHNIAEASISSFSSQSTATILFLAVSSTAPFSYPREIS